MKTWHGTIGCACGLLIACLALTTARAEVLSYVTAAGDGYWHDEMGSSYDFFDAGANSNSAHYSFYGIGDTTNFNTAYAQFSITGIPTSVPVAHATLNFYMNNMYITSSTNAGWVKHVTNASGANGNASQKLGGSDIVLTVKDQAIGWISVDVTSYLQADLDAGYSWMCFSFNPDTTGDYSNRNSGFSFLSADQGTPAYLSVVVPEPASFALAACGLLTLALRRKAA